MDSMYHSSYVASRLGVWKENGRKKLKTLLVKMGLPLEECKNHWSCMNVEFKQIVKSKIQEIGMDFGLEEITYMSFHKVIIIMREREKVLDINISRK